MPGVIGSLILIALIAYLWGSIPSGYWMGKLLRGKDFDIRNHGSRRIGATNVLRTLGKGPALIVFLTDISKGVGPALLATFVPFFYHAGWGPSIAGLAALLGHCFSIFIGFKGGRGVSTGAGVLLIIAPVAFVIALVATVATVAIWRYVSLGSIVGSLTFIVCGIVFYIIGPNNATFFAYVSLAQLSFMVIAPSLVILLHYDNIGRLLTGKERKIGQKMAAVSGNQ